MKYMSMQFPVGLLWNMKGLLALLASCLLLWSFLEFLKWVLSTVLHLKYLHTHVLVPEVAHPHKHKHWRGWIKRLKYCFVFACLLDSPRTAGPTLAMISDQWKPAAVKTACGCLEENRMICYTSVIQLISTITVSSVDVLLMFYKCSHSTYILMIYDAYLIYSVWYLHLFQ